MKYSNIEKAVRVESRVDNIIAHNNDTEGNSELIDIRSGSDGTTYETAGAAVRGQVSGLKSALTNEHDYFLTISERTNQLFDRLNAVIANLYPDVTTSTLQYNSNSVGIIIPIDESTNEQITVKKPFTTSRFVITSTVDIPSNGTPYLSIHQDNNAMAIASTLDSNAKYIYILLWNSQYDTNLDFDDLINGLMVNYGNTSLQFSEYYKPLGFKNLTELNNYSQVLRDATGAKYSGAKTQTNNGTVFQFTDITEGETYIIHMWMPNRTITSNKVYVFQGQNYTDITNQGSVIDDVYIIEYTAQHDDTLIRLYQILPNDDESWTDNFLVFVKSKNRLDIAEYNIDELNSKINSILTGLTINTLGDSFSDDSIAWNRLLKKRVDCNMVYASKGGSAIVCDYTSQTLDGPSFLSRIDGTAPKPGGGYYTGLSTSADITIIFGGINDCRDLGSGEITMGTISSTHDTTTFYGGMQLLLDRIIAMIPNQFIIGVIPPSYLPNAPYTTYIGLVQEAERQIYHKYHIPYVDLANDCFAMSDNENVEAIYRKSIVSPINYHPNIDGQNKICDLIQGKLQSMIFNHVTLT